MKRREFLRRLGVGSLAAMGFSVDEATGVEIMGLFGEAASGAAGEVNAELSYDYSPCISLFTASVLAGTTHTHRDREDAWSFS
mgnify:CR=1 FL=1